MNRCESVTRPLLWSMALLLAAFVAGCGGGGQDPILGTGGATLTAGPGLGLGTLTVAPGPLTCIAANSDPAIPRVISSDPSNGNLNATTSTTGAGANKLITATFSLAMNPATITPVGTFTLRNNTTGLPVAGTVTMSGASIANTIATFTTPTLTAGNSYTATILQTAATPGGVTLACIYAWTFTTVAIPPSGLSQVNLGMAAPFGIASRAGIATTAVISPIVNGNAALINTLTCNAVAVPGGAGSAGLGLCGANRPTLNGTAFIPTNPDATTANAVFTDLLAAYNSITPASLPLATPLGGATIGNGAGACAGAGVGCAGSATLAPGVYIAASSTSIGIDGTLTLDAGGNPDAVFIFQMGSTLTTLTSSQIVLAGGAKASNVWWQVGSSATIGVNSVFNGNVLAFIDLTVDGGATSCGRMLSGANPTVGSGAISLGGNSTVSVPGNVNAPPTCL